MDDTQSTADRLVNQIWKICEDYLLQPSDGMQVRFHPEFGQYTTLPLQLALIFCDIPFVIQERYRFSTSRRFLRFVQSQARDLGSAWNDEINPSHSAIRQEMGRAADLALVSVYRDAIEMSQFEFRETLLEVSCREAVAAQFGVHYAWRRGAIYLNPVPDPTDLSWDLELQEIEELMSASALNNRATHVH